MPVSKMTEEQRDIVNYEGDMLVIAAPGSGKTKTVIDKVEKLATRKDNDLFILAITYTYRAADEIADRLETRDINNEHIWTGTIHKFCLNFIINDYMHILPKYSKGYEIIDDDDLNLIRDKVAEELCIKIDRNDPPDFTINPDGNYNESNPDYYKVVKECYIRIIENRMMNFDLILYESYKLLSENKFIQENISFAIDWLIIDEYQDTKELQYQILALLGKTNPHIKLMFVGDPNQAIYTSLGGVVKTKLDLECLFERKFECKRLTGCFRSHQKIIDFYINFACITEHIKSKTSEYGESYIIRRKNCDIENEKRGVGNKFARLAINVISKRHSQGIPYEEMCVLLPRGYMLFNTIKTFKQLAPNIPIDAPTITPLKKMEDSFWNNISRLIFTDINNSNVRRCSRFLGYVLRDINYKYNKEYDDNLKESILDYIIKIEFDNSNQGTLELERHLRYILSSIIDIPANLYENELISFIDSAKKKIARYSKDLEDSIECFKSCYKEKSGVVFSTCHGCKGEEYRVVIVGGINESYIPYWKRLENREEAKRLLYVIFSRAKDVLVISSFTPRSNGTRFATIELESLNWKYD